ncbi:hypothetical protein Athai_33810 [Actinocatenispora thailandica]|uniref:Uncharacterized protein n=1 Tax=Actinocatenispora thailandica TaxID=227318 RepID=A0A7R7DQC2_9ACTN|nr:hypothetical protein Athai_33810 [Actinocatenispora thailandica]
MQGVRVRGGGLDREQPVRDREQFVVLDALPHRASIAPASGPTGTPRRARTDAPVPTADAGVGATGPDGPARLV